jgi:hypothetical protein
MTGSGKFAGWILLVAIVASLPAQAPAMLLAHERPMGCHEHGHHGPARSPSDNYRCCIAGHDFAILQPSAVPQVLLRPVPSGMTAAAVPSATIPISTNVESPPSADPPGAAPLRI